MNPKDKKITYKLSEQEREIIQKAIREVLNTKGKKALRKYFLDTEYYFTFEKQGGV